MENTSVTEPTTTNLAEMRSHVPIVRKSTIRSRTKAEERRLRTPIRPISKKRAKANREYSKVREQYLKDHPFCEWFIAKHNLKEEAVKAGAGMVYVTKENGRREALWVPWSTEIHHKKGRVGALLTDTRYFMALSAAAHRTIHHDTKLAYAKGYMLPR